MNNPSFAITPRTDKSLRAKLAARARRRETLDEANARVNRELSLHWRYEEIKQKRAVCPALVSMRPH
jgi:hypothetical protein